LKELQVSIKVKLPKKDKEHQVQTNPLHGAFSQSDFQSHRRASLQHPSAFDNLGAQFGGSEAYENPLHAADWSMFKSEQGVVDQSNVLFSHGKSDKKLLDSVPDSADSGSWDIFPDKSGQHAEHSHSLSQIASLKQRKHISRTSIISSSAQKEIDAAKREAAKALKQAKLAEAKCVEAEQANDGMERELRSRSATQVEKQVQARVQAQLEKHSKQAEAQKKAADKAKQRAAELEARATELEEKAHAAAEAESRAAALEERTKELEDRANAAEKMAKQAQDVSRRDRQEMKKLMSFRGDVATKAQLFAKRRPTNLERICKHAGQCGCSGFVTDIKASGFGLCVCGHSNSDHIQSSVSSSDAGRPTQRQDQSRDLPAITL
jgi:hypothetical protein